MKKVLLAVVMVMLFTNVAMAWWHPSSDPYGAFGVWNYWGPGYTVEWYGG